MSKPNVYKLEESMNPGYNDSYEWIDNLVRDYQAISIFYYYDGGGYEGSGSILMWTPKGWIWFDIGHCSCYGPLDSFTTNPETYEKLSNIEQSNPTGGDYNKLKQLIELARTEEYV